MAVLWNDFESEVVEGRYSLGKLVRTEGRCGWFETRFDEKAAIISLIESLNDETRLLDRLRAAEKIKDRNVTTIFEAGATMLRNTPLVYAVMEYTEENLEDVLRVRALSGEEAEEVAGSLVNALQAVHKQRLVCGRLEAASVLASGDTIKLRSDYLQLVPSDVAFEQYAVKDVRELGSLLYQCLTQKPLKHATDGNDPSLQLLPLPFVQIVRRTLTGQTTLDEIDALLHPSKAPASASIPLNPMEKAAPASIKPVRPPESAEQAKAVEAETLASGKSDSSSMLKNKPLMVGGFLVLLLLAVFVVRAMLHSSDHVPDTQIKSTAEVVAPAATPAKLPAPLQVPAAKPKSSAAPIAASPTSPAGAWRVVAFTYNREDQAEHKAQTINEKHSELEAGVFSPKGSGGPYLVTLGAPTDRASAFRLRDKAVQDGLPHDTYAQNYSR